MMKTNHTRWLTAALIILTLVFTFPAGADESNVPMPETYMSQNQVSQYINDAYAYLGRYPFSAYAPRVGLDLYMVAERTGYKELSDQMKWFLIYEHIRSLQGNLILKTFDTASEFRDFLTDQTEDQLSGNSASFADKYARIIDNGLYHFKEGLLDDDDFLVTSCCIANAAADPKTSEMLIPAIDNLSQKDPRLAEISAICLDPNASASQKAIKLHGQENLRILETYYLSTLSDPEKRQPDIARILISNAINAKNYPAAELHMDAMPNRFRADPQVLFWKGWIQYARHNDRQALETLGIVTNKYPQSPWADASSIFANGIRNIDAYHRSASDRIFAALQVLKDGIGILEADLNLTTAPKEGAGQPYRLYVGLLSDQDFLELLLYQSEAMIFGYRTRSKNSAICLAGRQKIITFNEPAVIPVPSVSLEKQGNGEFLLSAGLDFFSSIREAGIKTSSLFDSPYLSSADGVYDLIDQSARRNGWVPTHPKTKDGTTTLKWHAFSTEAPDPRTIVCKLTDGSTITQLTFDHLSIDNLRYGRETAFQLSAPAWPSYPVEKRDAFDVQIFMELMGAAIHLLNDG